MSSLDISKLKVTELRTELSQRKLPTKGKKDELVARLKEALEAESQSTESTDQPKEASDEKETTVEPSTDQTKEEISVEQVKESADQNIHETNVEQTKASEEDTSAKDQTKEETSAESKDQIKEETSAKESKEQPVEQEAEDQLMEEATNDQPKKEEVPAAAAAAQDQTKEKVKPQASSNENVKEKPQASSNENAKEKPQASSNENIKEKESTVKPKTEEVGSKRKRSIDREAEDEKRHKVDSGVNSSALFVKGFIRPLIIRHVQDLFSQYGTVKRFWMDSIKTHAYVIYETDEQAKEAYSKIHGIKFPSDTGKKLSAGGLTPEESEKLIEYEQNAAERRLKVDWEEAIKKIKTGQDLPSSDGGVRKARSLGIGQVAKQLAQASEPVKEERQVPERKELSLDDLFRKTQALPRLYYLPNTDEVAKLKLGKIQKH